MAHPPRNDPRVDRLTRRGMLSLTGLALNPWLAGCAGASWNELDASTLTIATGNAGGVFDRYGRALSTVLDRRLTGAQFSVRPTNASVDNVRLVAAADCDLAFSLSDTAADALLGRGEFSEPLGMVALARLYDSYVHVVTRADSGITRLAQLAGKRVGLGPPGSGTLVIARRLLNAAGVSEIDFMKFFEPLEQSTGGIRSGRLDAFFFVSGVPNSAIERVARASPIHLVDIGDSVGPLLDRYGPEYVLAPIPASTYGLRDATTTLSVKNYLLARTDLSPAVAYAATRLVFEAQTEIADLASGLRQPTLASAIFTAPVPLHPAAERYYREVS